MRPPRRDGGLERVADRALKDLSGGGHRRNCRGEEAPDAGDQPCLSAWGKDRGGGGGGAEPRDGRLLDEEGQRGPGSQVDAPQRDDAGRRRAWQRGELVSSLNAGRTRPRAARSRGNADLGGLTDSWRHPSRRRVNQTPGIGPTAPRRVAMAGRAV